MNYLAFGLFGYFAQIGLLLAGPNLNEALKANPLCRQFEDRCSICRIQDGAPICSMPSIACIKGDWVCTRAEDTSEPSTPSPEKDAKSILEEAEKAAGEGDFDRTLALLRPLAESGDPEAQVLLGWLYDHGHGAPEGPVAAFHWFSRAAAQGHPAGKTNMALFLREGRGIDRDLTKSVELLKSAADQGFPSAMVELAWAYSEGLGLAPDARKAFELMSAAAEAGHPSAQNDLGWMYEKGRGVARNDAEAIKWYRRAADQGHPVANENVQWMYRSGRAAPDDPQEALIWFRRKDFR